MTPGLLLMESSRDEENRSPDIPSIEPEMPVLAELLCSEVCDHEIIESGARSLEDFDDSPVLSYFDPAVLHHPDILSRLKFLESQFAPPKSYYCSTNGGEQQQQQQQQDILPYMRKVVASWMLEVCEERQCDDAVFPLAISILDQFLSDCLIKKEQLQLVACICLLLACKTRQLNHFTMELLCYYTDNSVSPQTLRTWELAILTQLNWDVNHITAIDFVDVLLVRSGCEPYGNIRGHAITLITLCATEPDFVGLKPSVIAASAIYAAVVERRLEDPALESLLSGMVSVSQEQLRSISNEMDKAMRKIAATAATAAAAAASSTNEKSCAFTAGVATTTQISEEVLV